jgi:hypothetical protein
MFCLVAGVYAIAISTLKLGFCAPIMHFCSRTSLCFAAKKRLPEVEPIQKENFLKNSRGRTDQRLIFLASVCEWDHSIYLISALTAYHAIGAKVVLAAICPPSPGQGSIVRDIVSADLQVRRDRILNIRRLINLSGVVQVLSDVVEPGDPEFKVMRRFLSVFLSSFLKVLTCGPSGRIARWRSQGKELSKPTTKTIGLYAYIICARFTRPCRTRTSRMLIR